MRDYICEFGSAIFLLFTVVRGSISQDICEGNGVENSMEGERIFDSDSGSVVTTL